jgi:hypothetical protein
MNRYTKQETASINAAWGALEYLCTCTNWSDTGALKSALKLEREQASSDEPNPSLWAKAMVLKAWQEGLSSADKPLRDVYWIRSGYMGALILGVRHAVERMNSDYTRAKVIEARDLATQAIEAHEAAFARVLERV